ncbi:MAG TPA: flavin reductase family protein [Mycobacteriales bacterium]|jgi:flavin reductase (DIM6/NTAB) family NADH-FMN oxidoreductase RutF
MDSDEQYPALAGFRAAVSRFAQGVAVLTTVDVDGTPHGVTVGSFIPLSKRPPLLGVALDRRAGILPIITAAGRFAVNVLDEGAEETSALFATKGVDRFAAVPWTLGTHGLPLLSEHATSVVECRVERTADGGDHVIVVGGVLAARPLGERSPLVYSGRRYFGIRSVAVAR